MGTRPPPRPTRSRSIRLHRQRQNRENVPSPRGITNLPPHQPSPRHQRILVLPSSLELKHNQRDPSTQAPTAHFTVCYSDSDSDSNQQQKAPPTPQTLLRHQTIPRLRNQTPISLLSLQQQPHHPLHLPPLPTTILLPRHRILLLRNRARPHPIPGPLILRRRPRRLLQPHPALIHPIQRHPSNFPRRECLGRREEEAPAAAPTPG